MRKSADFAVTITKNDYRCTAGHCSECFVGLLRVGAWPQSHQELNTIGTGRKTITSIPHKQIFIICHVRRQKTLVEQMNCWSFHCYVIKNTYRVLSAPISRHIPQVWVCSIVIIWVRWFYPTITTWWTPLIDSTLHPHVRYTSKMVWIQKKRLSRRLNEPTP